MQDLLERALFSLVCKDYRAKCSPIQIPSGRKNLGAKFFSQELTHLRIFVRQPPRGVIGIEETGPKLIAQVIRKGGFAGGDAAGNPDHETRLGHEAGKTGIGDAENESECIKRKSGLNASLHRLQRQACPA